MIRYLALLRGINVSGQKKVKMTDLTRCFQDLGFSAVQTYIQSGNIIFKTEPQAENLLAGKIRDKIAVFFGFQVEIVLMKTEQLSKVISQNPFLNDPKKDPGKFYVTFLTTFPGAKELKNLLTVAYPPEEFILRENYIYFYAPHGYGRAKMNNSFFEKKLKVGATTRNWKTVNTLFDLSTASN